MTKEILEALEADFKKHPVLVGTSVPAREVAELEKAVGFALPADYKTFVERFGGAIIGPYSVFGLRSSDAMGDDESSAIEVTWRFRKQRWKGTENWLVISMDHAGNPFGLDEEGRVFLSDHDAGVVEKVADTFEDFIRTVMSKPE
jgi:hypothetical protein